MAEAANESPRVLIVYPPGPSARGMHDALAAENIPAATADNVFSAVSAFASHPTDVVLLGIADLQERDLEIIRVLRDIHPGVYFLLAFPVSARDRAVKALSLGADSYILEPFYLAELVDMVRRALERVSGGTGGPVVVGAEELENFAGAVAHAINNPLQILELLLADESGGGPDDLRQETGRIKRVVEELLGFARRSEVTPGVVDLNEILKASTAARRGRSAPVHQRLTPGLPPVRGDEKSLALAFDVLSGLPAAAGEEGPLEVRTEKESAPAGPRILVSFRAPELTLPADELAVLFEPFRSPLRGEVGLSAATARAVVLAHGGTIEAACGKREGTTVTVRLDAVGEPDGTG